MKQLNKLVLVSALAGLAACGPGEKNKAEAAASTAAAPAAEVAVAASQFADENAKSSYAIGLRYGEAMARDLSELDLELFIKGMNHGFKGEKPLLEAKDVMATLQALQTRKMAEMQKAQDEASEANKAQGTAFLAENAKREGVKTTASGLQYEVLKAGEGVSPDANDKVTVHYHGTLPDGSVFDSSVERGEPASFPVNGVIKGWTEALQLMKTGAKWKLFIPSDLAYGERGAGGKIGPNQPLVFEVELLEVAAVE